MTSRDFRSCLEIRDEIRAGRISAEAIRRETPERKRVLNPGTTTVQAERPVPQFTAPGVLCWRRQRGPPQFLAGSPASTPSI